nr:phage tail sheath family protein [Chthoniobacterales bacterium]
TLDSFKTSNTAIYNFVKSELKEHFIILPPSGPVTGVYAATDTSRGVWKAPANVSLADVIEPMVKLDTTTQDALNVDATSGKSINALRSFAAKGTLVWGARTLDGNSNEWRYISVRRFFNMVEESVKKSTYWAVFETNDANTWVKVRGMIENYLTQKWRDGALAGATTKDAFFVRCGLGTTMTSQDILEGRMNVEIGMAVVRPAEFIILKFSHKLQTS